MATVVKTPIHDGNIYNLVEMYMVNANRLPNDLKNIPIGDWDVSGVTNMSNLFFDHEYFDEPLDNWNVSNVTNMSQMFNGCTNFNQPLNNWTVSNVTNMSQMFHGCEIFNQPLDNWIVSNVTNMEEMFYGCENFNQPLNNWDVSNVIDYTYIFEYCPIEEENKPVFLIHNGIGEIRVDPYQIHTESAKINYEKLIEFFNEKLSQSDRDIPQNINYATYINDSVLKMINESNDSATVKEKQIHGLNRIMNERLNNIDYSMFSLLLLKIIFYSLQYVLKQSSEFQKIYIDTFIHDCVYAHEGDDGMTCPAGALERVTMSLINPSQSLLSLGENPEYEQLISILIANPTKMIPEYIHDWYKLHKINTPGEFPPGTTIAQKKEDLKTYLLGFFPEEDNLIDSNIAEISDNIGYDDDVFMYGGRKRNTRKVRQIRKKGKSQKVKTNRKYKIQQNHTKKNKTNNTVKKITKTKKCKK